MTNIDKIIDGIPDKEMTDGYQQQRANLARQLALNASAYRVQQSTNSVGAEEKAGILAALGKSIKQIKASMDEVDRRLDGAAKSLKG